MENLKIGIQIFSKIMDKKKTYNQIKGAKNNPKIYI